ncbi:hypothetical protein HHX47_DHR4000369 [Lentinula edodes]|nr:hypothetical protein HHX47_DHR4000369 [Lentinula edodes]
MLKSTLFWFCALISTIHATLVTDVQGIAFQSPFAGKSVSNVTGVVTAKTSGGFYISGTSSSDVRASNGLFIFSETTTVLNKVAVGDMVSVTGTVSEFRSSSDPDDLTATEITSPTAANVVVLSTSNTVSPVKLGTDRIPPTQALSALDVGPDGWLSVPNNQSRVDTVNATLVPADYGLDFWASLEGQLVTVPSPLSVAFPNDFGEFWVVGDWPVTGLNSRGGLSITIGPDNIPDANPEAVIIGAPIDGTTNPVVSLGVTLSDITGVVQYQFGFYYILPLTAPKVLTTPTTTAPPTNITADITDICIVTFGDYNVDNFGPTATQLPTVASHIATHLLSPDIVFLQEIQDNDGATDDGVVSSNVTLSALVSAIAAVNGVTYDFVVIDPVNDADGGEPGGNIRQAYLYRSQKINLVSGSPAGTATEAIAVSSSSGVPKLNFNPGRIDPSNAAWEDSRKPLVAEWQTNGGATLFTVNLHLESKDGSSSTEGNSRPPVNSPVAKRTSQVDLVAEFVQSVLDIDSKANILVAGDCNEYLETRSVFASLTDIMSEMDELADVDPVERYTYVFDQNSEQLDHAFVSTALSNRQNAIQHIHSDAVADNLTYVDSNGHVIIKVDNTTDANGDSTFGRNSVYLESNEMMTIGSLLVFDAVHIPYGVCFPEKVLNGLLIVSQVLGVAIPVHARARLARQWRDGLDRKCESGDKQSVFPPCSSATSNQTGTTTSTNCTVVPSEDENTGCVVEDTQTDSFGAGFAENNGGVYAVLWDESGIAMWFFNRSSVPSDISSSQPDPTSWSTASAWYPASGCSPSSVFGPQTITLYIDICGAFAGDTTTFDETCSSVASNCTSLVQTASNYDNAYWEINYLRVFTT